MCCVYNKKMQRNNQLFMAQRKSPTYSSSGKHTPRIQAKVDFAQRPFPAGIPADSSLLAQSLSPLVIFLSIRSLAKRVAALSSRRRSAGPAVAQTNLLVAYADKEGSIAAHQIESSAMSLCQLRRHSCDNHTWSLEWR